MNTRMMVPATATTAMIITGFCSLETAVAANRETGSETLHAMQELEMVNKILPTRDIHATEFTCNFT